MQTSGPQYKTTVRTRASVIVPVLDDTAQLIGLLASLTPAPGVELIVVDASARPGTAALERAHPDVLWLAAEQGRAVQMNRGAAAARGDWLLFLHADSRLPPDWLATILDADAAGAVGGSFRFTLGSDARAARIIERGVAWRVRRLNLPYGDQALFVRRDVFDELGGFTELPIMEDVDLVRRLSRRGKLLHSQRPVATSARRWERDGWVRRTTLNLVVLALYFLGVHPARLAKVYESGKRLSRPRAAERSASSQG